MRWPKRRSRADRDEAAVPDWISVSKPMGASEEKEGIMEQPKKKRAPIDAGAVAEHEKVVDAAEAAKAEKAKAAPVQVTDGTAELNARIGAMAKAMKETEQDEVLRRLADEIINARNAHGGEAVFLRDIKCK